MQHFDPATLPAPDLYGHFFHPELTRFAKEGNPELLDLDKFLRAGLEARPVNFLDDAPTALIDRYFDIGGLDVSDWKPTSPTGKGWSTVAVLEGESCPVALFVRERARS